ncbi:molecular chaperone DnaJ [Candidatus Riesia pediculischaeffi]|uniref:Chaperone protein DnaJ n=1 Tax=Candidatus Riesia pediculischaeffi TaxID=428411 RepID=A0A1V0HL07_9ENTR|nr:molecular chaperone DnaJ [Candidatus Riesia pediculischaeffi]ARC53509.1 molecular chaperone DnaJ [Candidatus Riesia pediculischaeffi]
MTTRNYYEILGIPNDAEDKDIKKAYKRLAMKYHPDRNKGNKHSEDRFKEIKEAYEILSDPQKRSTYDQYGHSAFDQIKMNGGFNNDFSSGSTSDFGDIFGDVFGDIFGGNKRSYRSRGSDLQYEISLSLEESVFGVLKEIRIPKLVMCRSCNGNGSKFGTHLITCASCNGLGQIQTRQGFFTVQQTCSSCLGKGRIVQDICNKCNGNGEVKRYKVLSVKIPSGVCNGSRIRLSGEGESGKNGGSNGDLYVRINVKKHEIFWREKNDLYCEIPIDFVTASLGGEVDVPTIKGGVVSLRIPPETQTGRMFRIKGNGICSSYHMGDLICKVLIETPVCLNESQKKLLGKFKEITEKKIGCRQNNPISNNFLERLKVFLKRNSRR